MKSICISLFLIASLYSFSSEPQDTIRYIGLITHERMPMFPGGEEAMHKFISEHVYIPKEAKEAGIDGRVTLKFIVDKDGVIKDPVIVRGLHPLYDSVAISILNKMPQWIPALRNGIPDNMYFTLPIVFRLPEPNIVNGKPIYKNPKKKAEFPGGEEALQNYIRDNIPHVKPVYNQDNNTFNVNKTNMRFVVTRTGEIENITVITSDSPDLNSIATEIIKSMSQWIPAKHKGKVVDSYFTLPIDFNLVEEPPKFPTGGETLSKYLTVKILKEELECSNPLPKGVDIQFTVTKSGDIENINILWNGVGSYRKMALMRIQSMPKWIPAKYNGKAIDSYVQLSVSFLTE